MLQKPVKQTTSWMSVSLFLGAFLLGSVILFLVGGGIPPQSWLILIQAVRYFSLLWSREGQAMLVPFIILVLQSLLLAVSWIALIVFSFGNIIPNLRRVLEPAKETYHAQQAYPPPLKAPTYPLHIRTQPQASGVYSNTIPSHSVPFTPSPAVSSNTYQVPTQKAATITINLDEWETEPQEEEEEENYIHPAYAVDESMFRLLRDKDRLHSRAMPSTFTLSVGVRSIVGAAKRLERNEERVFAQYWPSMPGSHVPPRGMFLLTDGAGAASDGEESAHHLLQSITDDMLPFFTQELSTQQPAHLLTYAVQRADSMLHSISSPLSLAAFIVVDKTGYILVRGDCHCYCYRQSEGLTRLTSKPLEQTEPSPSDEAVLDIQTRTANDVTDDLIVTSLLPGDIFLCCSDGVWNVLSEQEIEQIVQQQAADPSLVAQFVLEQVTLHGGSDNASIIVTLLAPQGEGQRL